MKVRTITDQISLSLTSKEHQEGAKYGRLISMVTLLSCTVEVSYANSRWITALRLFDGVSLFAEYLVRPRQDNIQSALS
jgi:hypothetical protein